MPRYQKGKPPGPGRPPGSRNQSTLLFDEIGSEGTERLIRVVRECAEGGNMRAASIVLARTWPHRRGRPVTLDLPDVATAAGRVAAQAAVIAAMAKGELSPDEAASVAGVLEAQRRALGTYELEQRLQEIGKAIEEKKAAESQRRESGV